VQCHRYPPLVLCSPFGAIRESNENCVSFVCVVLFEFSSFSLSAPQTVAPSRPFGRLAQWRSIFFLGLLWPVVGRAQDTKAAQEQQSSAPLVVSRPSRCPTIDSDRFPPLAEEEKKRRTRKKDENTDSRGVDGGLTINFQSYTHANMLFG
jgi:hypothetical protein